MSSNYPIRVLERSAEILNCFTLKEPEKSLIEISRETNLNKSTVFRIIDNLEHLGWLVKNGDNGRYRIGLGMLELGSKAVKGLDFYNIARPHLEKLVVSVGQAAHLGIMDNGQVLYLDKLEHPGALISQPSTIGLRLPLHCTAMGKVLLAFCLKEDSLDSIIERSGLKKFTKNTITDKVKLVDELQEVKSKGYAVDYEEIQEGLRCIAAPIRDYSCTPIAAISISGTVFAFNNERLPELFIEIVNVSNRISRDLGCYIFNE